MSIVQSASKIQNYIIFLFTTIIITDRHIIRHVIVMIGKLVLPICVIFKLEYFQKMMSIEHHYDICVTMAILHYSIKIYTIYFM